MGESGSSLFTGIFSQVSTHHSGVHLAEKFPALKYKLHWALDTESVYRSIPEKSHGT